MKTIDYIFAGFFLFIMLFTVFQTIPLLEEEAKNKIELTKKAKATEENSGTDEDPEPDSGGNKDFTSAGASLQLIASKNSSFYIGLYNSYSFLLLKNSTPPPKKA